MPVRESEGRCTEGLTNRLGGRSLLTPGDYRFAKAEERVGTAGGE